MNYITLFFVAIHFHNQYASAFDAELSRLVQLNHAAVESMASVQFRFVDKGENLGPAGSVLPLVKGGYWRSADRQRIDDETQGRTESVFVFADRLIAVGTRQDAGGKQSSTASLTPNDGSAGIPFCPWRDAMMMMDCERGRGTQLLGLTLKQYLPDATVRINGPLREIYSNRGNVLFQIDPTKNYLIASKLSKSNVGTVGKPLAVLVHDEQVKQWQSPAPGIFFPKLVVFEERLDDVVQSRRTITFNEVIVNQPIAESVFLPVFPDGTIVNDFIKSTKYVVGADGRPKGAEETLTMVGVGPQSSGSVSEPQRPTVAESSRGGWWLLPAGAALLLGAVAVVIRRRRGQV